jgi:hypothetical protein
MSRTIGWSAELLLQRRSVNLAGFCFGTTRDLVQTTGEQEGLTVQLGLGDGTFGDKLNRLDRERNGSYRTRMKVPLLNAVCYE